MQNTFQKLVKTSLILSVVSFAISVVVKGIVLYFYIFKELLGHNFSRSIAAPSPNHIWFTMSSPYGSLFAEFVDLALILAGFSLIIGITAILRALIKKETLVDKTKIAFSFILAIFSFFLLPGFAIFSSPHGNDRIKSNLEATRTASELWFDDPKGGNETYDSVCGSPDFKIFSEGVATQGSSMRCFSSKDSYCAGADLIESALEKKPGKWCTDSTGYSGSVANCSEEHISCQ